MIRKDSANDNASIASSDIKGPVTMPEQATTDEQDIDKPKTEEQTDTDKSNSVTSNHSSSLMSAEEETQENIK